MTALSKELSDIAAKGKAAEPENISATLAIQVPNQGPPPTPFVESLVHFGAIAPLYVYAENPNQDDIMAIIRPVLAPNGWQSVQQRLAGLLTALLYDAGFESSWIWTTGVDMEPGAGTGRPADEWEAGAWQVSANSMSFDARLGDLVSAHCNANDPVSFQAGMKSDKLLAIHYAAVLFRCNTRWSGPCVNGTLVAAMSANGAAQAIAAMNELQGLV